MSTTTKWNSLVSPLQRVVGARAFRIAVAALVIYALIGFLLLPYIAERYLPKYAHETLQRQGVVADVRFNPFLFKLELDGVRLSEADGRPIVAARHLAIDFQLTGLFRWAWTFADIHADGLKLDIVSDADGRLNLAALADSFPDEEPPDDERTVRMLLSRVAVTDGSVTYRDLAAETPASTTFEPVNIELRNLTTLPERDGSYALNAEFPGGGSMYVRGSTHLKPFAVAGDFSIQGFRPAAVWPFLQDRLRLAEPQGEWVLQAAYRFSSQPDGPQFELDKLVAHIAGLDVREPEAQTPLLALETVEVKDGRFDLRERSLVLPSVALRTGRASARISENGRINWAALVSASAGDTVPADKRQAAPPAQSDDGSKKTPWRIRLDEVTLNDIALQADDRSRAVPLRVGAGALSAQLALDITAGAATRVQADVARIDAQALAARPLDAETPWATLDRVELTNGVVNTAERAVTVGRLAVQGGGMRVVREAGGEFQPVAMVRGRAQRDELAESTATSAGAWRFRLDALTTAGLRLAFADQGIEPALAYTLDDIALSVRDLAVGTDKRAGFTLAARVTEGGTLSAEGDFAPDGSSAATKLALGRVALEPLRALLARHAALDLKQGNASAELAIDYKQSDGGPAVQANGSARIDDLRIDEEVTGDRFLAWQSLNADAVEFVSNTEPPQLTVKDVRLTAPRARIEIFEDRSVNLAKVFDKRGVEDASRSPAATDGGDEEPSMRVEVARVRVENGTVFYADHSLVLPFSAQIREFRGAASGITSARDSRARLQFEGRVEDYGSAAVSGALSPFAPKRFTDIRTQFRNIDMPPLSPYSATFAGRKIAEGKLSLDLEYKIDNGRLAGDNDILLERFTLGERVQSPDALDLPLDLAVALLTDSRGRIDIAIPVSGNMNKPEFSLGGVIGEAVTRMLTRIVTAPFSALGKLFGGGEGANHIAFEPGNVRLTPPQQEKLVNVGKALIDRPQLQLTVGGRYDPKRDGEALRAQHVRRELAGELGIDIAEDEAPAPIAFEQAATQRALEALLEARAGDDAVDAFRADYEKRTGKPVARINPVLGRLGQASADHAFYEAVSDRLVEIYPLADAELEALAQARARAVKEALAGTEGIGAERVALGKTSAADSNRDGMIETQLSLDVFRAAAK